MAAPGRRELPSPALAQLAQLARVAWLVRMVWLAQLAEPGPAHQQPWLVALVAGAAFGSPRICCPSTPCHASQGNCTVIVGMESFGDILKGEIAIE